MRNTKSLTALGEIPVEMLSDMGSIPLMSIPEKPLKSSVLAVFLYIFDGKNRAKMPL